ncbi:hypothetical protein ACP4OV_006094 [Aristida adscensionis]
MSRRRPTRPVAFDAARDGLSPRSSVSKTEVSATPPPPTDVATSTVLRNPEYEQGTETLNGFSLAMRVEAPDNEFASAQVSS